MLEPKHESSKVGGNILISVLIGAAVVSVLTLAITSLLTNVQDGVSSVTFRGSALDNINLVRIAFSSGHHCRLNLLNRPLPAVGSSISFQDFRYANTAGTALTNNKIVGVGPTGDRINVKSIHVFNEKPIGSDTHLGRIQIVYTKRNTLGPGEIVRSTPVLLTTNSSNRIINCTIAEATLAKCSPANRFVSGWGPVSLPEGQLTQIVILSKYCECDCRVSGWVCRCYNPPPPPPPPPPSPSGGGGSGGDASADCASGDSGF